MPQFHTYIITSPADNVPVYHNWKDMLQLTKKAISSPKYKSWLKASHLLPVWEETVDEVKMNATKWEYIKMYLEGMGYTFEEI